MGSTLCNVFAAIALLILFANGVRAVFMFIAIIDDMSNDCIFKLLYTVVSILYAALITVLYMLFRDDNLTICIVCIGAEIILFAVNKLALRSTHSLYYVLAVELLVAAFTNLWIALTVAIVMSMASKIRRFICAT